MHTFEVKGGGRGGHFPEGTSAQLAFSCLQHRLKSVVKQVSGLDTPFRGLSDHTEGLEYVGRSKGSIHRPNIFFCQACPLLSCPFLLATLGEKCGETRLLKVSELHPQFIGFEWRQRGLTIRGTDMEWEAYMLSSSRYLWTVNVFSENPLWLPL